MKRFFLAMAIFSLVFLIPAMVEAADPTWTGGGDPSASSWTFHDNWFNEVAANNTALIFSGNVKTTNYNNFANGTQFNGLTFDADASAFTLWRSPTSGFGDINLNGDITNNSNFTQAINMNMTMLKAVEIHSHTAGKYVTVGGTIDNGGFLLTVSGNGYVDINDVLSGAGGVTMNILNELTLRGVNTYTGVTTLTQGSLIVSTIGNGGIPGNLGAATNAAGKLVFNGGMLQYEGTTASTDRNFTINAGKTAMFYIPTSTTTLTWSGACSNVTTGALEKSGAGTLVLSGNNQYSGGTAIDEGTLRVTSANALGTGNVAINYAVGHPGKLDIGTTNLAVGGNFTQDANTTLALTADSSTTFGKITSVGTNTITNGGIVSVNVNGYITTGATLAIMNGTAGSAYGTAVIQSTNPCISFSGSGAGGVYTLTASRSGSNSFSGVGATANSNAAAVGSVLDNITNPSTDMTAVLNAISSLSSSQAVASSLESMNPTVDGAVTQSSISMLNQVIDTTVTHLNSTGGATGISTGADYLKGVEIWAQGLGDYAHQDPRGTSNGYNATSWGFTGGADLPIVGDSLRMGIGSGYGQTFVRSKDSSGRANIDSISWTIYGAYENDKYPFYFDAAFTFLYNLYKASRAVTVGALTQRTASADYDGEQYSGYFEGGYNVFYKKFCITPLVSFNYMHLDTGSYTETGAGALNLSVGSQGYDMALSGFGARVAYPFEQKWGTLSPELHFKWLYDWIGDTQATTAAFGGGGTAFGTSGFRPARAGYDFGTKISFKTKFNVALDLSYDFLLKQDYYEHTGIINVRYSF